MRRALLVLVATLAVLAMPACGTSEPGTSPPDRPEGSTGLGPSTGPDGSTSEDGEIDEATGSRGDGRSQGEDQSQDQSQNKAEGGAGDGSQAAAGEDDLRVFAFATTDEAALAAEIGAMTATLAELESALMATDLDAAKAAARTLLDQAETLGADADAAAEREKPLEPGDAEMVSARRDAIDAFGLTADYASSIVDIANAVLQGQLGELVSLAQEAADLAGSGEELTRSYTDLNAELLAWAEANPADAARALAKYGEDA